MNATRFLEAQHEDHERLFKLLERADGDHEKAQLFAELATRLVAHDAIERELFYPACERKLGNVRLVGEALVEHGLVVFALFQAHQALGRPDFDCKRAVLAGVVNHHVAEEEEDLFPRIEKAMGAELLATLGRQMAVRFEEVRHRDYRGPLVAAIRGLLGEPTADRRERSTVANFLGHKTDTAVSEAK